MRDVYLFEGPDGAGKSTLIETLFDDARVVRHGPYPGVENVAERYIRSLVRPTPAPSPLRPLVLDRTWLSEPIYGAVYRGGQDRLEPHQERALTRVALGFDAIFVLCLPPYEACREAFGARRDDEYLETEAQLRSVYDRYVALCGRLDELGLASFVYDWTQEAPHELAERIADHLRARAKNRGPGIGAWRPGEATLLVGEQANVTSPLVDYPFLGLDQSGCSAWLADRLDEIGVPERDLYWINALSYDGYATDASFVQRLRPRRVIALGSVAERWCVDAGLHAARGVPHPQYWKRFHHHETYPLVRLLRRSS